MMKVLRIFCMLAAFGAASIQGGIAAFANSAANPSDFIEPASTLSPEEVVEIQLLGLQAAGTDRRAGIEQVWRFAHPDNRKMTGPISRFSQLFDLPAYAPLIGLQDYVINDRALSNTEARFVITVRARDGAAYGYVWTLRTLPASLAPDADYKADNTQDESAPENQLIWMTTAVSAPYAGGGS
ncbi:MAG: hypothetical protein ISQ23_02610 [Alphaproteobacteria bacterium]|nr:hypothetical protein [Alphaproteobacteria bacterium]MBL6776382.1 hypothetical protein [Alphaproteobacteria bacterium]